MRVLIVSAFLAYAAAAPSGIIAPIFYQPVALPAAVPTISPGDIQAAAIDAQVKVNDLARAAVDKAQEYADLAVQNVNEKVVTDVDQVKERNLETFWSNEDKKWQALDAANTAAAQIDGAAASNADLYAKTVVGGVVPYVAPVAPIVPAPVVAAPIAPIVFNPYLPGLKTVSTPTVEIKEEEKKEDNLAVTVEAAVKNAEPEKAVEVPAEKTEEKRAEKSAEVALPAVITGPIIAPFPSLYGYNVVAPVVAQPIIKYAPFPAVHGALAPTFVQKAW